MNCLANIDRARIPHDVIILDDGFQHRYLDRDLDIVILKKEKSRYLIPAGPFGRVENLDGVGCVRRNRFV